MNYKHFTIEERCCLREYYVKGKSYREIARLLGRNVSSVSRELRRNCTFFRDIPRYYPYTAQKKSVNRYFPKKCTFSEFFHSVRLFLRPQSFLLVHLQQFLFIILHE